MGECKDLLLFGNVSKYVCGQPNSGACQHVAYIPFLPDSFQDFATYFCSKWSTQKTDLMTHCWQELMHGVWKFLQDKDFIHAYKSGMLVKCVDGIECQVYPQIFTYFMDYPEKWFFFSFYYKWILNLILLIESCLPLYETRVFTLVLNASFQNQNLTRLAWSMTVNFSLKMFAHTCSTLFKLPRMQFTS